MLWSMSGSGAQMNASVSEAIWDPLGKGGNALLLTFSGSGAEVNASLSEVIWDLPWEARKLPLVFYDCLWRTY